MQNIMQVFRPFIGSLAHADYLLSHKWDSWVYVRRTPEAEDPRFLDGPEALLCTLVGDFFDLAEGRTATEAVENALTALRPYLAQLPPYQAEYAEAALRLYVKMDDLPTSL